MGSTKSSKVQYFNNVILPDAMRKRDRDGVMHHGLAIYDMHVTNIKNVELYNLFAGHKFLFVVIPAGMTGMLSPGDQPSFNGKFKKRMRTQYSQHVTARLTEWLDEGKEAEEFVQETRWSRLKPDHARWIVQAHGCITEQDIIKAWTGCGIYPSELQLISDTEDDDEESDDEDLAAFLESDSDE